MKINRLKIKEFKNLRDFEVEFSPASLTTVLLGQNGTGKSNLLEAILLIFRDLDLGEPPAFEYEICYECRAQEIFVVAAERGKSSSVRITANGQEISFNAFSSDPNRQFLPKNVFGYYSGPSSRFEAHFSRHQDKFYRQLLENQPGETLRPFFYARLIHSQFVLLAFFYERHQDTSEFLRDYLGIQDLESILFVLREPPWSSKHGDPRFWFARGAVQAFLDKLFEFSLAPLKVDQRVDLGLRKTTSQERLYLFLKDREALQELRSVYPTPAEFFKALESTYLSKLLAEVRIRVQIAELSGALSFRELSEGEQQLLTVLGLLRFTREDETLFLLDEPDTHLNPVWSLHYLELLNSAIENQRTCQIVMATHDPLTIAGLTREEVRVMYRDEASRILARMPEHDPKGMGVSGILTSDLFGLRSDLDLATLRLLDEKRDLSFKEVLSEAEKVRLAEIRKAVDDVDLSSRVRDPEMREVLRALWTKPEFREARDVLLTPEQQEKRKKIALEAMAEVEAESQQE